MKEHTTWNTLKIIGILFGFFVTIVGFNNYIDFRINKIINEPEYRKKVAKHIRPSIVFDLKGVVLFDLGGMNYEAVAKHPNFYQISKFIFESTDFLINSLLSLPNSGYLAQTRQENPLGTFF